MDVMSLKEVIYKQARCIMLSRFHGDERNGRYTILRDGLDQRKWFGMTLAEFIFRIALIVLAEIEERCSATAFVNKPLLFRAKTRWYAIYFYFNRFYSTRNQSKFVSNV